MLFETRSRTPLRHVIVIWLRNHPAHAIFSCARAR